MYIIKGPDFPTGGIAIMSQNAYNGYRFGRGQLTLRAKTIIDEKKRRIEITEMPYNVNKATFIETVAHLARDKKITGIRDIRDESGRGGVSVIIELKEDANAEQIINQLFKHTQLEVTVPLINLAVQGKMLKSFNIIQMLTAFINYRREVITEEEHLRASAWRRTGCTWSRAADRDSEDIRSDRDYKEEQGGCRGKEEPDVHLLPVGEAGQRDTRDAAEQAHPAGERYAEQGEGRTSRRGSPTTPRCWRTPRRSTR